MSPRTEKYRYHSQFANSLAMQRRRAFGERRPHQFEKGEHDALAGQQLAELGYELLERPRPLRVARAVGEKDESSLGHSSIIFDANASR